MQGHRGDRLIDHVAHVELDQLQLQAIGLDLRQIEHVIDQRQQRLGAAADDVDVFALGAVERGLRQDLRHADHAVHGRADFVADVGEKIALGAIGGFRRELGIERRRLGALQIADVDDGAGDPLHVAGAAARHGGLLADPAFAAVLEQHAVFAAVGGIFGRGLERRVAAVLDVIRMHP